MIAMQSVQGLRAAGIDVAQTEMNDSFYFLQSTAVSILTSNFWNVSHKCIKSHKWSIMLSGGSAPHCSIMYITLQYLV